MEQGGSDSQPGPGSHALTAGGLQDRAVRGAFWTLLHVVLAVPVAFLVNAVVARALGPAEYGQLAYLSLVVSVLTAITHLGTGDGVIQWGAAAYARGDVVEARLLLRRSLGYHVLVQLPLLAGAVVYLARHEGPLVILALVLSVALPACLGSAALTITIENRSSSGAKVAIFSNVVTQSLVAGVAVITHLAAGVWAARALGPALTLPANFIPLTKEGRRNALRMSLPRGFPEGFWRYSLLSALGGLLGTLVFSRSEVFVLKAVDALTAAGLFALAAGIANQITAPVDALLNPIRPAVAGIVSAHPDRVADSMARITRAASLITSCLAAVAIPVLVAFIPMIYGEEYRSAAFAFLALGMLSCAQSIVSPLTTFTHARRDSGVLLRMNAIALAIDAGVAFASISRLGLWGAVLANVVAQVYVLLRVVRVECAAWNVSVRTYLRAPMMFVLVAMAVSASLIGAQAAGLAPVAAASAGVASGMLVLMFAARFVSGIDSRDVESLVRSVPPRLAPAAMTVSRLVVGGGPAVR